MGRGRRGEAKQARQGERRDGLNNRGGGGDKLLHKERKEKIKDGKQDLHT